jgi:hypothetical protein
MSDPANHTVYQHDGFCPICDKSVRFTASNHWYRDWLICPLCRSVVRERALGLVLKEMRPNWRTLTIHESSPFFRGISAKLRAEGKRYIASHYFPDQPRGTEFNGFRNEDLEHQTFPDDSLDIVISLDVMEHVFRPDWFIPRSIAHSSRAGFTSTPSRSRKRLLSHTGSEQS